MNTELIANGFNVDYFHRIVRGCNSRSELWATVNGAMRVFGCPLIPRSEDTAQVYSLLSSSCPSPDAKSVLEAAYKKCVSFKK